MQVIFLDIKGRRITLFEGSLESDYLYCVSRAVSIPRNISPQEFIADMEKFLSTHNYLQYSYNLKNHILSLEGDNLIDFICNKVKIPGISSVHLYGSIEALAANKPILFDRRRERIFSRGAPIELNSALGSPRKRFQ